MIRPVLLQNATVPAATLRDRSLASGEDTARVDIGIEGGRIAFVAPAGSVAPQDWEVTLLAGRMVWPCFADLHTHMDTAQIWPRTPNPDGSFASGAAAMIADREAFWTAEDMRARIDFGLRCAYAHGTRAMRTHLASYVEVETRWAVCRELRQDWAGRVELRAASLVALGMLQDETALDTLALQVKASGGVLGAFAPMAADIEAQLHPVFAAAERHDLSLDFHADETHDSASQVLAAIARVAQERRFAGPVVVGHASSLAMQDEPVVDRTLDLVAAAGLTIVTLPTANLYLQDRATGRTPRWRGITLLHEMKARGIPVAIGSDNTRDPFHPYGDYDMLDTFGAAVRVGHLDHPFGDWPSAVTTLPSGLIDGADVALGAGAPADLVVFRARSFNELLARAQSDRMIMRGGQFITPHLPDYAELDGDAS